MNIKSQAPKVELLLRPREVLTLNNPQHRMAIECKQGVLWVTSSGDRDDHVLSAGQFYTPVNNKKVVIEAIDEACVDIEEQ